MPTFTVGHGTWHNTDRLAEVLEEIDVLLDCRSHPGGRISHYHKPKLEVWVPRDTKTEYWYYPKLGGFSENHLIYQDRLKDKVNIKMYAQGRFPWTYAKEEITRDGKSGRRGFLDFQWFMTLPNFFEGVYEVIELAKTKRVAMMCAEAMWFNCHRSMLADYLWHMHRIDTVHLRQRLKATPMQKFLHSENFKDRLERYYPEVLRRWELEREDRLGKEEDKALPVL
jgi:hypothetical protein